MPKIPKRVDWWFYVLLDILTFEKRSKTSFEHPLQSKRALRANKDKDAICVRVKKNGEMLRVIIWGIREKKELKGKRDEKERKEGGWVKRGLKKNRGWKTKGKRRK